MEILCGRFGVSKARCVTLICQVVPLFLIAATTNVFWSENSALARKNRKSVLKMKNDWDKSNDKQNIGQEYE